MIYLYDIYYYIYYDIYYYDIIWYNRSLPYSLFIRYILEPQWKSSSHLVGCTSKSQTEEASWERHRRTSSSEQCSCIVFELQGQFGNWMIARWYGKSEDRGEREYGQNNSWSTGPSTQTPVLFQVDVRLLFLTGKKFKIHLFVPHLAFWVPSKYLHMTSSKGHEPQIKEEGLWQ